MQIETCFALHLHFLLEGSFYAKVISNPFVEVEVVILAWNLPNNILLLA